MYIALEGLKGCGKSTVFARLPQRLRAHGVEAAPLCPTRPIPGPHWLEQLAAGSDDDALRERVYAARSNYHAAHVPPGAPLVLGDRSILTSYATRWDRAPAGQRRACIERVDAMENVIRRPDHVIWLEVPEPELLARLRARTGRDYGRHDETPERLRSAALAYRDMREHGHALGLGAITWHVVAAGDSPDAVLERVSKLILDILMRARPAPCGAT